MTINSPLKRTKSLVCVKRRSAEELLISVPQSMCIKVVLYIMVNKTIFVSIEIRS